MASTTLFDVPPEVLVLALRQLEISDLQSLTAVCKYLKTLGEPCLYRDIIIRRGQQAAALVRSFAKNRQRVRWVRSLLVSTRFGDDRGLHSLPPWIAKVWLACRLHRWQLSANNDRWTTCVICDWRLRIAMPSRLRSASVGSRCRTDTSVSSGRLPSCCRRARDAYQIFEPVGLIVLCGTVMTDQDQVLSISLMRLDRCTA